MAPPCGENEWHLFNLRHDPRELDNVAKQHSDKLAELKAEWDAYAASIGYIEAGEAKQLEKMSPEEFFRYNGVTD